jgi:hypothetical protein
MTRAVRRTQPQEEVKIKKAIENEKVYTMDELKQYDGSDPKKPMLLAIK